MISVKLEDSITAFRREEIGEGANFDSRCPPTANSVSF
jgi:hypothetical protein